jgi:hypothetical protein
MTAAEINDALRPFQGGLAQLWEYAVSHTQLVVRLSKKGQRASAFILCIGCATISAPTVWRRARIVVVGPRDQEDVCRFQLLDELAGVAITCGHVEVTREDGSSIRWLEEKGRR